MADFTDRIKLIVDVTTDQATKGFGDIKGKVGEAEGAFGKLKAAGGGAMDALAQNANLGMAGIATAVSAFVISSVGDFQRLALEVNQFGDAVGLSVEDASKWIEVAGDIGVNVDTLEGAVNKLNIAASKGALTELGIGGDTTNERLLNALTHLQGIDDATERAKQGMKLFGKSWTELAPLVESAGSLRAALDGVSDAKIIDEAEVQKAKNYRDAMDNLADVFEEFKLTIGGDLIAGLAQAATALNDIKDAADGLIDAIPGMDGGLMGIATGPLRNVTDGFGTLTDSTTSLTEKARGFGQMVTGAIPGPLGSWAGGLFDVDSAQDDVKESTEAANAAVKAQAEAAKEAQAALDSLLSSTLAQFNGQLALEDAATRTGQSFDKYKVAADTATTANWGNKESNDEAAAAMNAAEGAALKQAAQAAKLAEENAKLNGTQWGAAESASAQAGVLRTLAGQLGANDPLRANLLAYADQLEKIPKSKNTEITADTEEAEKKVSGLLTSISDLVLKPWTVKVGASTPSSVTPGSSAAPSSALAPLGVGRALPTALALPRASSAPTTVVNVNVAVAPLTHPAEVGRQVANYLDAFYRRNGTRLRAVP